ncbi:hypothetical protein V1477_011924 [Vespula maculifrons]|uniref:Uncharacterized protein n=1 Tax=Vespula maculifrons TaxID=7453 RepID=A0ABD2C159_VESMC
MKSHRETINALCIGESFKKKSYVDLRIVELSSSFGSQRNVVERVRCVEVSSVDTPKLQVKNVIIFKKCNKEISYLCR